MTPSLYIAVEYKQCGFCTLLPNKKKNFVHLLVFFAIFVDLFESQYENVMRHLNILCAENTKS